jgi:hypothetical protein
MGLTTLPYDLHSNKRRLRLAATLPRASPSLPSQGQLAQTTRKWRRVQEYVVAKQAHARRGSAMEPPAPPCCTGSICHVRSRWYFARTSIYPHAVKSGKLEGKIVAIHSLDIFRELKVVPLRQRGAETAGPRAKPALSMTISSSGRVDLVTSPSKKERIILSYIPTSLQSRTSKCGG